MFNIKLIPNWKKAWKFACVWVAALTGFVEILYRNMVEVQQFLPEGWITYATIAVVIARVLDQGGMNDRKD